MGCCVHGRTFKIDAPKMRGRRQEFHANTLPSIAGLSEENNAAFLFFLSGWIFQDKHFAVVDFVL